MILTNTLCSVFLCSSDEVLAALHNKNCLIKKAGRREKCSGSIFTQLLQHIYCMLINKQMMESCQRHCSEANV